MMETRETHISANVLPLEEFFREIEGSGPADDDRRWLAGLRHRLESDPSDQTALAELQDGRFRRVCKAMDLCLHNLPVRLIANGGGLVYAPLGPTHLAIEDMAIMRALPRMTVVAPADKEEMARFIPLTLDLPGPVYIRLGKGGDPIVSDERKGFTVGKAILMREPGRVLLVSTGVMTNRALTAAELLNESGLGCGVLHMHTVKPLDDEALLDLASQVEAIVTIEEHTLVGGLGSAVRDLLCDRLVTAAPPVLRLGIPDTFPDKYGTQDDLLAYYGLQPDALAHSIREFAAKVG